MELSARQVVPAERRSGRQSVASPGATSRPTPRKAVDEPAPSCCAVRGAHLGVDCPVLDIPRPGFLPSRIRGTAQRLRTARSGIGIGAALGSPARHGAAPATSHWGPLENLRPFVRLLEPGSFASSHLVAESRRQKEKLLFSHRLKEDLTDFRRAPVVFLARYCGRASASIEA